MATFKQIYQEAKDADDAWQAELVKVFGKQAGDKRYTKEGEGEPESTLRRLYEAKLDCDAALGAYHMSTEACGN